MSRAPSAHLPTLAARPTRAVVIAVLSLSLTGLACGSSDPGTKVLGEVEVENESIGVQLIEPVCITNTPNQEPC